MNYIETFMPEFNCGMVCAEEKTPFSHSHRTLTNETDSLVLIR